LFNTPNIFKKISLTTGLLLIVLVISAISPAPESSPRSELPERESSDISVPKSFFLPLMIKTTGYRPTKIYCMGDSLTSVDVYEPVLVDLLGPDWVTVNKGISAQNTAQMLARFQHDIIDPGDAVYVVIWGGAIDVRYGVPEETTKTSLQGMYTMAHNAGIKVVAVTITPQNDLSAPNKAKILSVNSWIKNTAINVDFVADAYTAVEDPNHPGNILPVYDLGDHVHFSYLGYSVVAETIYDAVIWIPNALR
jgi:lysophospholipase L1-like esterase